MRGWQILVVEDDFDTLDTIKTLLEFAGASVQTAMNGLDGLQAARDSSPQFIICDLSMPVMDGWTMVRQLKNNRRTSEIPVIALTAHALPEFRERAISLGFHDFMTKPVYPETFAQDIANRVGDMMS